ncbi:MAG: hypothetical protein LBT06_16025 [Hungatella sp.]|jgi:hypothetical protein|nr:hypothetical protein [Hungatella sp.]
MSEIYVMKMAERLDDSLFFLLQNFISLEKKLRIQNLCNTPHRTGILAGDLLIQYILCNHLKIERDEIFFG